MYAKTKLEDILELHRGYDLPERERAEGNIPIISSSGYSGVHNDFKCDGENVITGRCGTIGEVFYHKGKCWPLNTALYVSDFKGNNAKYIYYLLKCFLKKSADGKDKSTVPGVDRNVLHQMKVPFCKNIPTQKQIIKALETVDRKIELNKQLNDNLAAMIKTIYEYWFVQFEFPDRNGKPYKSSGGKMVWNEQLKREIPIGWKSTKLSDLFQLKSGYSFSSQSFEGDGKYKILTISNVQDYGISLNSTNYLSNIPENMPSYCLLKEKDILMSLTGNVARVGIMFAHNCLLNQRVALAEPLNKTLNTYIYCLLKSDSIRKRYEAIANGSSQQNLSPIEATKISIAYEPEISTAFSKLCSKYLDAIVLNLKENEELNSLRDWLLPMLMNGQATIED